MDSSKKIVDGYLKLKDWRVKENSNRPFSYGAMNSYMGGEVAKDYWLREIYPQYIADAYVDGHIHIHDLGCLSLYCCGYSLKEILKKGVRGVQNIPVSGPAKHFDSVLNQIANLVTVYQNEIAGAVAFNSFDTLLAPFIKVDGLDYEGVVQNMQNFIYSVNSNSRAGAEPAFSNITFDLTPPEDLLDQKAIVGGKKADFTYRDCQKEMDMLNRAFCEIMLHGDDDGKLFAYPIPTYNIHKRFDWDNPNNDLLWEMAGKFGLPYFANFINSDMEIGDVRSMCCRLRLDLRELRKKNGGLFGAGDATGCYDDQTEILTDNRGWILFKDLTKEDVLITRNPQGIIEKHHPVELFEYDYEGEMYHFKNTVFDMKVTPNHKMVFVNKHTWEQGFVRADEYSRNKHPIPRAGEYLYEGEGYFHLPSLTSEWIAGDHDSSRETTWAEKVIPMEDWLRFVGLYLSEGSCDNESGAPRHGYRVNITQLKKENLDYIKDVLDKLPFYYKQTPVGFLICDKQLWTYCRNTFGKNCYEKRIPREYLSSCSKIELSALLEALMVGDGSVNKGTGQKTYYTTSKQLANDFQELCLKTGFSTNVRQRAPRDVLIDGRFYPKENNATTYEMTITKNKTFNVAKKDIKKEYYKGKVYCCEVPNHTLYVRRNGKATWCGNSIGVVTINLPRLGYEHKGDKEGFFKALRHYLDIAKDSLEIKRKWLQENILDTNAIPAFMEYVGTMNNHFSVIGEVGANEMCENFMGKNILDPEAHAFVHEVHEFILDALKDYQEETGNLYAFEATPAEGTCYRFAMKDKSIYTDIITQGNGGDPYYTNSCHIPVKLIESIDKTFKHQEDLQVQFNSGTVIHIYLEGAITGEQAKSIIYNVCHNYKVPYVSLSPISRYCPEHGYVKENVDECPICGERLKKYQRITGYLRCIDNFNNGKAAEFRDRKQIKI